MEIKKMEIMKAQLLTINREFLQWLEIAIRKVNEETIGTANIEKIRTKPVSTTETTVTIKLIYPNEDYLFQIGMVYGILITAKGKYSLAGI